MTLFPRPFEFEIPASVALRLQMKNQNPKLPGAPSSIPLSFDLDKQAQSVISFSGRRDQNLENDPFPSPIANLARADNLVPLLADELTFKIQCSGQRGCRDKSTKHIKMITR